MNKLKKLIALGTTVSMLLSFVAVLPVSAVTIADGDLVKAADSSAVYYIQGANKRVFPHANVYHSWGYDASYATVKTVSSSELAAYADANAMPFRDGALFRGTAASLGDKDATAVFYVENAVLRPVLSEQVYQGLFSDTSWSKVTWVPDDLLTKFNYDMGENLTTSATHPDGVVFKYSGTVQKYVVEGGLKRAISDAAFTANRYREADVLTLEADETYADGTSVTGVESGLLTPGWLGVTAEAGALTVSMVSVTGATLPGGASNVSVFSVRLTAGSTAADVTGLTFKRTGIGAYDDWDALYLYEGNTRITASARTLNSDSHEVEFPTLSISVAANSSKTLTLKGDFKSSPTAGGLHAFQLKAVETSATVAGLPLTGSTFTGGATDVSTVEVAAGAIPSNPSVGATNAEVATLKLTAGTQDVEFNQVVLTMTGSLSRGDISNIKLYHEGTLLASASGVQSNDTVTLTLDSPYTITEGQNRTFSIKADLGGRVDDTLTTKVEEAGHVFATDKQYGYGAAISDGAAPYTAVTLKSALTLQGGTVTLTDNGPVTGSISKNAGDVQLLKFAMTADRALEIRKLEVRLCIDSGTDVELGSTTISDLRIKDTDTGSTVMSKSITSPTNWGATGTPNLSEDCSDPTDYVLTDIFNLSAGVTRNLAVTVDLGTSSTLNDHKLRAYINVDSSDVQYSATQVYMKDVVTGDYLLQSDVVPATLTGDDQTMEVSSLTAVVSSTPVTGLTVVKGATEVEGVGVNLTAGDASAINVKQLQVRVYVDDTSKVFLTANEDTSPKGEIIKVSLWDDNTKLGEKSLTNTTATPDYGLTTFDGLDIDITAGATKKLVVKFDVSSESEARWVAVAIPESGYSAYDSDDNSITTSGIGDVNSVSGSVEPDRYTIVTTAGSLAIVQDNSTPVSAIILAGTSDVVMSKIKFSATREDWTVQELTVGLETTGNEGSISEISISYDSAGSTVTTEGQLSSGTSRFTGMNWLIPQDTEAVLTIMATFDDMDPNIATTGREFILGVECDTADNCKAVGGSQTIYGDTGSELSDADGTAMYLRKSRPIVSSVTLPSTVLIPGTNVVNKFNVTANSAGEINLKKLSWDITIGDAGSTVLDFTDWRLYKDGSGTAIAGIWANATTTSSSGVIPMDETDSDTILEFEPTDEISISAGTTALFTLKTVAADVVKDTASISVSLYDSNDVDGTTDDLTGYLANHASQLVQIDNGTTEYLVDFLWSDRARGINHEDAYEQTSYLDWTNSYLINLPTDTYSLSY